MRILFLESETRISNLVFAVYFACDLLSDGSYDVFFMDSEGDQWQNKQQKQDQKYVFQIQETKYA